MTLSAERKKEIEAEVRKEFDGETQKKEEEIYREQIRKKLAKGSVLQQGLKFVKEAVG